jgi:hypothetical protein
MRRFFYWAFLAFYPGMAMASDPQPLFEIFIEWPLVFFSVFLFLVAILRLRNSLVVNLILLPVHLLVIWWALEVDYMGKEDNVLWLSLAVNIVSVVIGFLKISKDSNRNNDA